MKRTILLLVLCCGSLLFSSCDMSPRQRVSILEDALERAEAISEELGGRITQVETTIKETQSALSDPYLPAEYREELNNFLSDSLEIIQTISTSRAEWTGRITILREQIEAAKADDLSFGEELQIYGNAITSVGEEVPPPAGAVITLVGVVVGAIGAAKAITRKRELKGVVRSVDILLDSEVIEDCNKARKILKDAQPDNVRASVQKIKGAT